MDIFTITVMFRTKVVDVGRCDSDHISLITLIHATIEELSGKDEVPNEDCLFEDRGLEKMVFELENTCYVPSPPEGLSSRPNEVPEVLDQQGGYQALGWCDSKMLNYDGDSEKDDDKDVEDGEDSEGEGRHANEGHNMQYNKVSAFEEESVDGDDDILKECMDLFEGYQSKSNDEYFSDSELEPEKVRIAKLVKGIPFKKMMDGEIQFEVGQTFDNVEQMKEVFREYAIQEGVALNRVKNDLQRQTYNCKEIYNNKEAKIKWIASKFEDLVKANPSICVKVINDLLREKYCARHIYANFRLTYKGDHFKQLFWRASRSSIVFDFKETMDEIGVINPAAQSIHRASSYLDLLEFIRRMVMRKFQERNEDFAGNMEYELLGPNEGYTVKLGQMKHIDPPPRTVQPGRPKIQRKREPDEVPKGGKSGTVTCKLCSQVGHNKRTCKNKPSSVLMDAEFCNEVYEILARHESRFDQINVTLQTVMTNLQALQVTQFQKPVDGDNNPFAPVESSHQPILSNISCTGKALLVHIPDLSQPSLYHTPQHKAPIRDSKSTGIGILSPPLEPRIVVKLTK
ncbi:hypothetical protein EZV62_008770 [Acer yangbiense]|uniref:Transposase MuDR plant domain-containing protein n=1 Tax=Acer yangbiense TaxID=1000413 RepID=A0A5C7IES5_9ROSI|nr:hypothetical protein EZV62_008770 [Acer yangbiense]